MGIAIPCYFHELQAVIRICVGIAAVDCLAIALRVPSPLVLTPVEVKALARIAHTDIGPIRLHSANEITQLRLVGRCFCKVAVRIYLPEKLTSFLKHVDVAICAPSRVVRRLNKNTVLSTGDQVSRNNILHCFLNALLVPNGNL